MRKIELSSKQAQRLKLKKSSRLSPVMEKCCLILISNESFMNAQEDIEVLTGIRVPLMENLYKVGLEKEKLKQVKNYLWQGLVSKVMEKLKQQKLGITIGSGQVESLIKQIAVRMKIVGSQWEEKKVSQMLKLRCRYLNGDFGLSIYA